MYLYFFTSITEVVTVGLTSVKQNGQNSNFPGRKPPRYLNESVFGYGIHFPIALLLIESRSCLAQQNK